MVEADVVFIPNEIWCLILDYLEYNEAKENLEIKESKFTEKKEVIKDTYEFAIDRLLRSARKLSKVCHDIDREVQKIGRTELFDKTVYIIDDSIIDLRGEIISINYVISQLIDSKCTHLTNMRDEYYVEL